MLALGSEIDRVTVYHRGATVVRLAQLSLQGPVPARVTLADLPLALEDATVQVAVVQAPQGAQVFTTGVQVGLHAAAPQEAPGEELHLRLRQAQERQAALQQQRDHLLLEVRMLESVQIPARPLGDAQKPPPPAPLKARVGLEQFTYDAISERRDQLRQLRRQLQRASEEVEVAQEALRRASSAATLSADSLRKSVTLGLHASGPVQGQLSLQISYFVEGASWAPQYQCAVDRARESARVTMRALVHQQCGEDWGGVHLTLSTAEPTHWSELPSLRSRRIGRRQAEPPPSSGLRPVGDSAQSLFGDFVQGSALASAASPAADGWSPPYLYGQGLETLEYARNGAQASLQGFRARLQESYPHALGAAQAAFTVGAGGAPMAALEDEDEVEESYMEEPAREVYAADMPEPSPALRSRASAAPMPRADKIMKRKAKSIRQEDAAPAPPAPPRFSSLVLGGATSAQRGKLIAQDSEERYARSLREALGQEALQGSDWRAMLRQASQRAAQRASLPAGTRGVREHAGFFDYAYDTQVRVDVPSDEGWHSIPVLTHEARCLLEYVAVPRVKPHVYRVARLENLHHSPMLPGQAEVYVDGDYVLTTELPLVAPRAHFKLGLGVEQSIKCARNTRYQERRSDDSVVATAEHWHQIQIELANRLPRAIQCEVRERLPQPAEDAEVVVEESSVQPAWEAWVQQEEQPLRGGRRWRFTLEPGEETQLKAEYTIKVYIKNDLVGGNRREA